jgi:ankyrin repeat protein
MNEELIRVLHNKNAELVKKLIKQEADVNYKDIYYYTPLMIVSYWNDSKIIDMLIKTGARLDL